ncbi:UNKNOWN [Stylonychia lemnae]|uniref:RRM domain-containing protein n=1 Tax=Stylonychia lemnae TaxID=5949 RepID=A0A077ZV43_STYLE|nr:UNKNOWN [Stylonychia lemnae]|eukprot:CDW73165.1 UNKNOWN [Stylonychia lemnae]
MEILQKNSQSFNQNQSFLLKQKEKDKQFSSQYLIFQGLLQFILENQKFFLKKALYIIQLYFRCQHEYHLIFVDLLRLYLKILNQVTVKFCLLGINYPINRKDIKIYFKQYGQVEHYFQRSDKNYGFLIMKFDNQIWADKIRDLLLAKNFAINPYIAGHKIKNQIFTVKMLYEFISHRPCSQQQMQYLIPYSASNDFKVYISNIDFQMAESFLRDRMSIFGKVINLQIFRYRQNYYQTLNAVVLFDSVKSAQLVLNFPIPVFLYGRQLIFNKFIGRDRSNIQLNIINNQKGSLNGRKKKIESIANMFNSSSEDSIASYHDQYESQNRFDMDLQENKLVEIFQQGQEVISSICSENSSIHYISSPNYQ